MKSMIILGLLAATPALADCPTGSDLAAGIRVVDDSGANSVFSTFATGVVQQNGSYEDGYQFRSLLAHGTHILQLADLENGVILNDSISNTSYSAQPQDLPVPAPNMTWNVDTVVNYFGDIYSEQQSQTWGSLRSVTVGPCTFDAIAGKARYVNDQDTIQEGLLYFPDLGISVLTSYADTSGPPETYTILRIEKTQ